MNERIFKTSLVVLALLFTAIFCVLVIPPLLQRPDIIGAFAAGFVNPFAAGYSTDVFFCWFILSIWIWFESATQAIRHGWVCLVLGIVPGVAVGFALYLLIRHAQLQARRSEAV